MPGTVTKRYRTSPAKPGQLKAVWGKEAHMKPSIVYLWGGEGADKSDARVLCDALERPQMTYSMAVGKYVEGSSLADELKARGYDLTTLRFTIEKVKT